MKTSLLNTKVFEKNDLHFILSLYKNQLDDGRIYYSYYSDYLGYGVTHQDELEYYPKDILSNTFKITLPLYMNEEEIEKMSKLLIDCMENLTFNKVVKLFLT